MLRSGRLALGPMIDRFERAVAERVEAPFVAAVSSGTAAEVTPIRSVDDHEIGDPGPVTRAIQYAYLATVTGREPRFSHWLEHVPASAVTGS